MSGNTDKLESLPEAYPPEGSSVQEMAKDLLSSLDELKGAMALTGEAATQGKGHISALVEGATNHDTSLPKPPRTFKARRAKLKKQKRKRGGPR